MESITLKKIGYRIEGYAVISLWGGGVVKVKMDDNFIPLGKMTAENLYRCINDGRYGCESIDEAHVDIFDAYEQDFHKWNRKVIVKGNDRRAKYFCRGI
jgi:hypothetical protein